MELRDLPSVDAVVDACRVDGVPDAVITSIARVSVESARQSILDGGAPEDPTTAAARAVASVAAARPKRVINATGVLLHTNLGRAPWPRNATDLATHVGTGYSNVEVDITTGRRASRHDYLGPLIATVTGAGAGFAVNNNAGALLLALASQAGPGGKVAVSRGELIEIGGSFRLPDLMRASGVELVEVGTTNRTRIGDYESVADSVDAVLKVHPSNYRIDGFQEEASWADLAELAGGHGIPFIADVGSGLIDETAPWVPPEMASWFSNEPGVRQVVDLGADLVLFSGDKLLGGPQAGVIAGTIDAVSGARKHPIARAVRLDGAAIAGLSATFETYANSAVLSIPFWQMATASTDTLRQRAAALVDGLDNVEVVESEAVPGAGSVPGATIPSVALRLSGSADSIWGRLAAWTTPVITTRRDGAVLVDLRSVDPDDDGFLRAAITQAMI